MRHHNYEPGKLFAEQVADSEARLIQRLREMERRVIKWAIVSMFVALIPATKMYGHFSFVPPVIPSEAKNLKIANDVCTTILDSSLRCAAFRMTGDEGAAFRMTE
jgi:hypothetical protein